jgi:hypothetical protein
MKMGRIHPRIIQPPFASFLQGGRLDGYYEHEQNVYLDVQGLQVRKSELFEREGRIFERVIGSFIPLRLKFSNVSELYCDDFFTSPDEYPEDDPSRTIVHFFSWRQAERMDIHYRFGLHGPTDGLLHFFARQVVFEKKDKPQQKTIIERDWSPCPPMPERLVPRPQQLDRQFGGDPITINLKGRIHHRKLFVGELSIQPNHRPQVDAVLNLGEQPSRWVKGTKLYPNDRIINRGEEPDGMSIAEICEEANWVIKRLEQNLSVLVHCVAGMNRSSTICCAVLMLQEGLSAGEALERVRQHHPWARPDSHHWLALRWLEKHKQE